MTESPKPIATLDWSGGLRFDAGAPDGVRITLDGNAQAGPSPVTTLLCAAGACSGADVVDILLKKRITVSRCHIEVGGRRRDDYPRRFVEVWLRFHLAGDGLTETAARRAVDLSVTKYCSVLLSLNPDVEVRTEVVLDGAV